MKIEVKETDMNSEMIQKSINIVQEAQQQFKLDKIKIILEDIASYIKDEFERKFGPTWHCVVGKSFGSRVSYEIQHFILLKSNCVSIMIFKCDDQREKHYYTKICSTAPQYIIFDIGYFRRFFFLSKSQTNNFDVDNSSLQTLAQKIFTIQDFCSIIHSLSFPLLNHDTLLTFVRFTVNKKVMESVKADDLLDQIFAAPINLPTVKSLQLETNKEDDGNEVCTEDKDISKLLDRTIVTTENEASEYSETQEFEKAHPYKCLENEYFIIFRFKNFSEQASAENYLRREPDFDQNCVFSTSTVLAKECNLIILNAFFQQTFYTLRKHFGEFAFNLQFKIVDNTELNETINQVHVQEIIEEKNAEQSFTSKKPLEKVPEKTDIQASISSTYLNTALMFENASEIRYYNVFLVGRQMATTAHERLLQKHIYEDRENENDKIEEYEIEIEQKSEYMEATNVSIDNELSQIQISEATDLKSISEEIQNHLNLKSKQKNEKMASENEQSKTSDETNYLQTKETVTFLPEKKSDNKNGLTKIHLLKSVFENNSLDSVEKPVQHKQQIELVEEEDYDKNERSTEIKTKREEIADYRHVDPITKHYKGKHFKKGDEWMKIEKQLEETIQDASVNEGLDKFNSIRVVRNVRQFVKLWCKQGRPSEPKVLPKHTALSAIKIERSRIHNNTQFHTYQTFFLTENFNVDENLENYYCVIYLLTNAVKVKEAENIATTDEQNEIMTGSVSVSQRRQNFENNQMLKPREFCKIHLKKKNDEESLETMDDMINEMKKKETESKLEELGSIEQRRLFFEKQSRSPKN
ncbi:unnamed protein product [Thelazia callipaeda]|uniref:Dynein light chain n=1 Tax=Thelazia callipaeda TaxID=103827 RepID=A0A158RBY3_THECL|nr:unnamed protein product [Thelazia callipaeda]